MHQSSNADDFSRHPTDDAIEAIILQATSASRPTDARPLRDTRTQLFVGNLPYRVRWQDLKDLFRKAGTILRADVSLGPDNRSRGFGTVLLATAEDAGRAVDMFNGYSWQTRVLEVRLDRLMPEYEQQQQSLGMGVGFGLGGHNILAALGSTSVGSSTSNLSLPGSSTGVGTASGSGSSVYPLSLTGSSSAGASSSAAGIDDIDYGAFLPPLSAGSSSTFPDPNSCRNLFVGNLPFHTQWQDLKDLFRQAGTILRADVALGPDNRSRGFGTVVFATDADAERAVRMFNGFDYSGRILKVNYDRFSYTVQGAISSALSPADPPSLSLSPAPGTASSQPPTASSPLPAHNHATRVLSALSLSHSSHSFSHPSHSRSRSQSQTRTSHPLSAPHTHAHATPQQLHPGPGQLKLPPGFMYDYGPPSGPTSPYEMFGQIQQMQQAQQQQQQYFERQQSHSRQQQQQSALYEMVHQKQREQQREREREHYHQEREQKQHSRHFGGPSSALDIESLTSSLVSARLPSSSPSSSPSVRSASASTSNPSSKPPSTKPISLPLSLAPSSESESGSGAASASSFPVSAGLVNKSRAKRPHPPSLSAATSSGSTTTTSTSGNSEKSLDSTAASSVSPPHDSPVPREASSSSLDTQTQKYHHPQQQQQQQQHPHHPGPISLPPLPPVGFPMQMMMPMPLSPHTPHGHTMMAMNMVDVSPLHHPSMGSPYQMPMYAAGGAGGYYTYQQHGQGQGQMVPLTPHGLPPITPSMPPFTFLPSMQQHQSHLQQPRQQGGGGSSNPSSNSSSGTSGKETTRQGQSQSQSYQTPSQATYAVPMSSPGYMMPSQQAHHAHAQAVHAHAHAQAQAHAQAHAQAQAQGATTSTPLPANLRLNLATVHGAFSPGVVMSPGTFYGRPGDGPNPNPFINAAVGAPVHMHMTTPGVHPVHPASPGYSYPPQAVPHGAYFYAMSSPKKGPPTGMEPKGYFDPMYFPAGVANSGLANEVKQHQRTPSSTAAAMSSAADALEEEMSPPTGDDANQTSTAGTSAASSAGSSQLTGLTSWNASDGGKAELDQAEQQQRQKEVGELATTISRAHSVGHARKPSEAARRASPPGISHRSESDPAGNLKHKSDLNVLGAIANAMVQEGSSA